MTKLFPDGLSFSGYNTPSRIECDIYDLEVEGDVPPDLNGRWYRSGPDPQYPPYLGDDIYVNGDGMISMFNFENGHVDFKMRYIQTERWKAERAARRSLYGKYRNPWTDKPEVAGKSRGTANTAPIWHAGRLLVLKEDHVPMAVDPDTLATLGDFTWNGQLKSKTVTAHPKIDPVTGELLLFSYECEGDGSSPMCFLIEDKSGNLVKEEWFDPPYVGMVHDFAITTDYVIFPIFPTTMDPERLKAGGDHWKWDGSLPSWVGIMPRAGSTTDIRWFKVPTSCGFHVINGFNEGTIVHLDMMISKRNGFPYIGDIAGSAADPQDGVPYPTRWSFDMTSNAVDGGFSSKSLAPYGGELPLIDPRCVGRDYRYAYISMVDPERRILMAGPTYMGANMIGKIDLTTGEVQTYHGTDETSFQEGAFIPRGPGEDEGWYINIADRHDQNRSDLLIFDARAISEGPLATARLPIRLRSAFHTTWVPGV
ncbi:MULTISPECIES: carotenoid oxygenase family protein [Pseudomonadota]|jgi:carotenoid cleavage dioxygenase-like enzyme|uniref:Dioxygenase n=5 Tax=Sphingomonadales TaxID=204457 RepID=A0A3A1P6J4_9SPHN|nr:MULTISPECIES: carotenoid oxygenase family protein [Sphingomonadales]MBU0835250.1 carotenoid oxygenase family protein [Alphaproteobacteria bacterium]QHD70827.1 hypothetical protein GS397_27060 [Sphingobium yanoikuyae]QNG49634.1 carotenoid oxygenase family protein [Sphingobium yanoikuyae]RIV83744.1 hypothetical protein D2V17_12535 [Aurantiacibacter xanthus]